MNFLLPHREEKALHLFDNHNLLLHNITIRIMHTHDINVHVIYIHNTHRIHTLNI